MMNGKYAGGNDLVRKYVPGSQPYERAGAVVDGVFDGSVKDPTGGATHSYSPAGMHKLVAEGSQTNEIPRWLADKERESDGATVIGNRVFAS